METQEISTHPIESKKIYEYSIVAKIIFYLIGATCVLSLLSPVLKSGDMLWSDWYIFSVAPVWLVLTIAVIQKKAWAAIYFFIFAILDLAEAIFIPGYNSDMGVLYGVCMLIALLIPHKRKIGWQVLFHKQEIPETSIKPYSSFVKYGLLILAIIIGINVAYGYIHVFETDILLGLTSIAFWSLVILQLYLIYKRAFASYIYFIVLNASYLTVPLITGEHIDIPALCIASFFIIYLTLLLVIPIEGQSGWKLLWGKTKKD